MVQTFELEPHHIYLLSLACEALDRGAQARKILQKEGLVVTDRFGQEKTHPLIAVERDSALRYARLLRELCLDDSQPDAPRVPRIGGSPL